MNIIENIKTLAKQRKRRIVLPETMDKRVLDAAVICANEAIADIVLIGREEELTEYKMDNISIIDPYKSELTDQLVNNYYELRKDKGVTLEDARTTLFNDYMYYACMLVKCGYADGVVSGACHSSANTLKPALQIIKTKEDSKLVSAFFLMNVPNCKYGNDGVFVFSDAGLNQNPTSEELAYIAKDSADSFKLLTNEEAYVAFLSHSTYGSARHGDVDKVVNAVNIAKNTYPNYYMDGEMQLDAAIDEDIAKLKAANSYVAGHANVLIFPDLDAGNIGYKLVERLGNAEAYGPITQGIKNPINDLSRGCSVADIVGVVAITSVQCK